MNNNYYAKQAARHYKIYEAALAVCDRVVAEKHKQEYLNYKSMIK